MIRPMETEDLPEILALENELFPESPWPREEFLYEMNDNPFSFLFVEVQDGVIAGYLDYWIMYENAQLCNIGVRTSYKRRGIGRKLLNYCIEQAQIAGCEYLSLEVRKSNTPAIRLYESAGFIDAAVRKNYYEDGEDARLMVLPLEVRYDSDTGD